MRGYNSLRQFVDDHKLLRAAKKIDPGRDSGETVTSFLKKRVDQRLVNASKQFNNMLKKRDYSKNDLILIAIHDTISGVQSLEAFVKECFGKGYVGPSRYKKVLASTAFQSGRLKLLYSIIPRQVNTKTEFVRFLKTRRYISKEELQSIMSHICEKNWRLWLYELIDKEKIREEQGRWVI